MNYSMLTHGKFRGFQVKRKMGHTAGQNLSNAPSQEGLLFGSLELLPYVRRYKFIWAKSINKAVLDDRYLKVGWG